MTPNGAFALGGAMTIALAHWFPDEDAEKNAASAGGTKSYKLSPGATGSERRRP